MTDWTRVIVSVVLVTAYVALVPRAGFFTATGLYLLTHMTYLGVRPIWRIVAVTAGVLLTLYVLFQYLLRVDLPHGLLY